MYNKCEHSNNCFYLVITCIYKILIIFKSSMSKDSKIDNINHWV